MNGTCEQYTSRVISVILGHIDTPFPTAKDRDSDRRPSTAGRHSFNYSVLAL